jgi:hypothetical protein
LKYNIRVTFDTVPICIFYKVSPNNYKEIVNKFLWENLDHITEIDWINNNENFNWQERKKNELKMQFKWCSNCIYKKSCQWVWKEYGDIYWGKEFNPITV